MLPVLAQVAPSWTAVALTLAVSMGALVTLTVSIVRWLLTKVDGLVGHVAELDVKYEACRAGREKLEQQNTDQQRQIEDLKRENRRLQGEIDELRRDSPPRIQT